MATPQYIGRFAPSPTGPLHFGSLVAAMGSYLQARSQNGVWLLRIEDIDPPREVSGASESIIRSLDSLGFEWNGETGYQRHNTARYEQALDKLNTAGHLYACNCSRKQISAQRQIAGRGNIYPGTCRERKLEYSGNALRLTVTGDIEFCDSVQGIVNESLDKQVGDFIVKRRDGLFAYQLAVVVDDAAQGISEVVRGADLLDNTARQIYLQRLLDLPTPRYCHLPVAINRGGKKLSKQTNATPIDSAAPLDALARAWEFLGQNRFNSAPESIEEFWNHAIDHWSLPAVPKVIDRAGPVEYE